MKSQRRVKNSSLDEIYWTSDDDVQEAGSHLRIPARLQDEQQRKMDSSYEMTSIEPK